MTLVIIIIIIIGIIIIIIMTIIIILLFFVNNIYDNLIIFYKYLFFNLQNILNPTSAFGLLLIMSDFNFSWPRVVS